MRTDIVVPIYNAPDDVRRCVDSVLAHTRGDYRLVLIDDASPDPAIAAYCAELAGRALPHVTVLANARNLGFTGTANRGMALSRADVILLNSDTVVTAGWLDALIRCAGSDPRIGTVTPFSNNAEICSFPRFCENNVWPEGADPEPVRAALAKAAVPTYPDLPTGVGFCFYVKRALIDAIGTFDPAFGAGYGEENDFCLRAAALGWRNVLCDDAFVLHTGGRSFTTQKDALVPQNTATLLARHPGYIRLVRDYIAADPPRALREAALAQLAVATGPSGGVLHVIHDHGGGTETHVRALIAASRGGWRNYLAVAVGDHWQVEEHRADGSVGTFEIDRLQDEPWRDFLRAMCSTFGVGLIHLHNISACREGIITALEQFDLPYGYTVHDVNFACPTITFLDPGGRYCGGVTDPETCQRCLAAQPAYATADIVDWRRRHHALASRAAFLIAPSQWAADQFESYFGGCRATVIAHGTPRPDARYVPGARTAVLLPDDDVPTIAVLGAIGPDKGARRLERLVALSRERGVRVRFVLIGYLDREHGPWQSDDARFTVHGRYDPRDLPDLLAHYRVALVLYPSAGPETFSYTLSEAWAAHRPVLVPPIGALAERVRGSGAGWVMTDGEWHEESAMLARIVEIVAPGSAEAHAAAAAKAQAMPHATLSGMATATIDLYAAAYPRALRAAKPLLPRRVRDALGYHPWRPPVPPPASAPAAEPVRVRVARVAGRLRRTGFGTWLYRQLPAPMMEALKARLR